MKYLTPFALTLVLSACAHQHDCHCSADVAEPVQEVTVEEEVVVEEVVEVEVAPEAEEQIVEVVSEPEVILEVQTAPQPEATTTRRVVTRRLVDAHDAGTPTAPAMDGSAADDALLSETPRVLEDTTIETTTTIDGETTETVIEEVGGSGSSVGGG